MAVDERARHRLYRRLEEVLGTEEAGTLMTQLPPVSIQDLATKRDLEILEHKLTAKMERLARQMVIWMSSMVLASAALAFAAGRFV
jgi:hypothetical protein